MSSPKAAPRAAVPKIPAAVLADLLSPARAEASRRNGAQSRGPKTAEGKARSAQNALKHGLRAEKFVVVRGENPQAFAALESALAAELAPDGVLQGLLAGRIARAAWRLERAERIEAELFERHGYDNANLGLAMIRDGNGARAFDSLLRYRGTALAELWRALRLLKALQAEAAAPRAMRAVPASAPPAYCENPNEPEAGRNPDEIAAVPAADQPEAEDVPGRRDTDAAGLRGAEHGSTPPGACLRAPGLRKVPIEPECHANPCESAPDASAQEVQVAGGPVPMAGAGGACAGHAEEGAAPPRPASHGAAVAGHASRNAQVRSSQDDGRMTERAAAAARWRR
jgi:hypothetical protein